MRFLAAPSQTQDRARNDTIKRGNTKVLDACPWYKTSPLLLRQAQDDKVQKYISTALDVTGKGGVTE
ncbi:hypothetical protein [Flagellimonas sp.]|uniref:hypothetical protein n=1 Tax=Flagellimonas sp. TaxID=2058762 RepID=UPI003B5C8A60